MGQLILQFFLGFRFIRRRKANHWFYVYDPLARRHKWTSRPWLWDFEVRLIEERYSDDGKLVFQWVR